MVQENGTSKRWCSRGMVPTLKSCVVGITIGKSDLRGCVRCIDAVGAGREGSAAGMGCHGSSPCEGCPRSGLQSPEGTVWVRGCFQVSTPGQWRW